MDLLRRGVPVTWKVGWGTEAQALIFSSVEGLAPPFGQLTRCFSAVAELLVHLRIFALVLYERPKFNWQVPCQQTGHGGVNVLARKVSDAIKFHRASLTN